MAGFLVDPRAWSRLVACCLAFTVACGQGGTSTTRGSPAGESPAREAPPIESPAETSAAGAVHTSALDRSATVFVIVLENLPFDEAMKLPHVSQLAAQYGQATDYRAVAHPSLPNYLAMTSGSTYDIRDDGYHRLPVTGIGDELSRHGLPWRAYMEGMGEDCLANSGRYAVKHNPFAYYGGACPPNVVPLSQFPQDFAGTPPRFAWITPDLCNDGHDCPGTVADAFLADWVARITSTSAWQRGGVLYVVWDEDDGGSAANQVACLVISPHLADHVAPARYDHYSLLATMEDQLGVPRSGQAAAANAMAPLFK